MARYTGPDCKLCRREGMKLFLKGERCMTKKCAFERRPTPPGPHQQRRRKPSEYGLQLREKQKARRIYGVLERQFRKTFGEASKRTGMTGETLLRFLELRLDNVVFRLGLAANREQARQLVTHGHFDVNGVKTNIASYRVRVGDTIKVRDRSRPITFFKDLAATQLQRPVPQWLSLQGDGLSGAVLTIQERQDCEQAVREQLIVEYYSRRV
ncbi:MAG: 30S ribosomal protein S4 [Chloroflexota bacterium]